MDVLVTGSIQKQQEGVSTQDVKIIDAKYFQCVLQSSIVFPFICCRQNVATVMVSVQLSPKSQFPSDVYLFVLRIACVFLSTYSIV